MKTSKPFSTISYNSDEFLYNKLSELVEKNILSFWAFVRHIPEDDETKSHIHLYIVPNGQLNTDNIRAELQEIDLKNPTKKPLGCMPCKSSKFADWFLYGTHNRAYLSSKGQARKHHYNFEDIVSSEPDYLREEVQCIDYSKFNKSKQVIDCINAGIPLDEMVYNGFIAINQITQVKALIDNMTYRNGRNGHEPEPIPPENDAELAVQKIKKELNQIEDFKNAIDSENLTILGDNEEK